jgi:hypothetical protein
VHVPIKPAQRRGSGNQQDPSRTNLERPTPSDPAISPLPPPEADQASAPGRAARRYQVRLHVNVVCGAQSFHSNTRDVSAGGLAFEDKIPSCFFGQYCRIYIYRSMDAERIDLRSRIFPDPKNPRRLQFVDPPQAVLDRLIEWAEALEADDNKTDAA